MKRIRNTRRVMDAALFHRLRETVTLFHGVGAGSYAEGATADLLTSHATPLSIWGFAAMLDGNLHRQGDTAVALDDLLISESVSDAAVHRLNHRVRAADLYQRVPFDAWADALGLRAKGRARPARATTTRAESPALADTVPAAPKGDVSRRGRALSSRLMGLRGSWNGYAQKPLSDVPAEILAQARAYFLDKVAIPRDGVVGDGGARSAMRAQIENITIVLEPEADALPLARALAASLDALTAAPRPVPSFHSMRRRLCDVLDRAGVEHTVPANGRMRWQEVDR
jgi:hypothetical protein